MAEYERAETVDAPADAIFDFVADIRNMPRYLPTTRSAQPQGEGRVRVQGEANGHAYDADGYVRADRQGRRLEWGADERYYSGWLQVSEATGDGTAGRGMSEVRVHLSFRGSPPGAPSGEGPSDADIEEGLAAALRSIADQVKGTGPKTEPAAAT